MKKVILKIGGMTCSGCSSGLEKYLNRQKGIKSASVNLVLSEAVIEYENYLQIKDIEKYIKECGFESLGEYNEKKEREELKIAKWPLVVFGILAILILYISMGHMLNLPTIPYLDSMKYPVNYALTLLVLSIPFLIYGYDIFRSGIKNALHLMPNMDTLVTLGVLASLIYSLYEVVKIIAFGQVASNLYFESCAIIIYFIKLGRLLDQSSREKTKEALKELVQITPTSAILKDGDGEREITIDEIKKDDILICKPGSRVAADGIIVKGSSHFDEAFITGESMPTEKKVGASVIAGSININGYIEYRVEHSGKESTISEIVRLVRESSSTKSKSIRLADKISSYFIPIVLLIAVITFIYYLITTGKISTALIYFVTVLLTACPCALGLGAPLAIVVSEGLCAKNGLLVKSSEILEEAGEVSTIVFDKTGTLTNGNLQISKILNYSSKSTKEIIKILASISSRSSHPLSKAITSYAQTQNIPVEEVTDFEDLAGIGLTARLGKKKIYIGSSKLFSKFQISNSHQADELDLSAKGNSIVYLIEDKEVLALVGISDTVRTGAKKTIETLAKMGKKVIMLTGDNALSARLTADTLNITKYESSLMPKEKVKVIKDLTAQGEKVMMVGDGINDAPSLASATVGVSFQRGTDIASDSSSVILTNDNLEKIPILIKISQKTKIIIKENLFWAFFYNICMLSAATGILRPLNITMNPMLASLAMTLSSLSVVLNSLRLKKINLKK